MIKIIGIFFIFCFIFDKTTKKYVNPYKCIGIFGKKGSGKTTLLTKLAMQHIKKGWHVYSTIDIPGCITFNVEEIGFYTFPQNSLILIDEIGMIFDNRNFKNFKTEWRDWFKYQRQYKCKVYWFSQVYNDLDLKIRVLTDELWLAKPFMRIFSIRRRICKSFGIKETSDGMSTIDESFKYDSILLGGLKFTFIPRYVPFFKSYNPKPLGIIDGTFYDFNDLNRAYIKTSDYIINSSKELIVRMFVAMKKRVRVPSARTRKKKGTT